MGRGGCINGFYLTAMSRRATGTGPSARGRRSTTKTEAAPSGEPGSSLTEQKSPGPCEIKCLTPDILIFKSLYVKNQPDYLLCSGRCKDGVDGSYTPQPSKQGFLMDAQHRSGGPDNHNHDNHMVSRSLTTQTLCIAAKLSQV